MNENEKEKEMLTDKRGRPWERLVYCGSELDVTLRMPSLLRKMRHIIQILDESGDRKEAKKLSKQIWNDTQFVWYALHHRSIYGDEDVRDQAYRLAEMIEEFQQDIIIGTLGMTDTPYNIGEVFLSKMTERVME